MVDPLTTPYGVIVRGPLGAGKTTVSKRLAQFIAADYLSIDDILDQHGLEEWDDVRGCYSERSFLQANEFAAAAARPALERGDRVVFDGNFYWSSQVDDLVSRLACPVLIFTLKVPLDVCITRDGGRMPTHGPEATKEVFALTTSFSAGIEVDATRPIDDIVGEILSHLPGMTLAKID